MSDEQQAEWSLRSDQMCAHFGELIDLVNHWQRRFPDYPHHDERFIAPWHDEPEFSVVYVYRYSDGSQPDFHTVNIPWLAFDDFEEAAAAEQAKRDEKARQQEEEAARKAKAARVHKAMRLVELARLTGVDATPLNPLLEELNCGVQLTHKAWTPERWRNEYERRSLAGEYHSRGQAILALGRELGVEITVGPNPYLGDPGQYIPGP